MWFRKGSDYIKPNRLARRSSFFIDRDFQVKYTSIVICAAALGIIIVLAPIYYFMNQNYSIFIDLAYDHAPTIISHLEQERVWMNTLLLGASSGLFLFFFVLGVKMTAQIVGPLKVLRNHLRMISRGHWNQKPISVREDDEFQDIIESYNYFFNSQKNNIEKDLQRLAKIRVNENNRDDYYSIKNMIEEKASQLGRPHENIKTLNSSGASATPDSRRAS